VRITVRVTPRGGRDAVEGWTRDAAGRPVLKVRVAASAAEGQANAAVIALIAKALGRPRSGVKIVGGAAARVKRLSIEGLEPTQMAALLGAPPPD
jgi:uncharacterized protein YggU (UPF0235/DUF167 family)